VRETANFTSFPIIQAQGSKPGAVQIKGLMVSLDRMERGLETNKCALDEISEKYQFPARAIVSMKEVIESLYSSGKDGIITDEIKKELDAYYAEWGAKTK